MKNFLIAGLLILGIACFGQSSLSGIIKDATTGDPLAGATVQLSGSNNGSAITDSEGKFILTLKESIAKEAFLTVRFVGYETVEYPISEINKNNIQIELVPSSVLTEEVVVRATRAEDRIPMTFSNLEKPNIRKQNFGQDMPFILQFTPSVVSTSDAGTGIGYTGIRIRGSDATRINVTINGIPYNDSESQGVFWVDIPDIATSSQSIQIQRGVGTSGNGAGAFGATINLQTNTLNEKPSAELIQSAGSFNTLRTTISAGTGKLKNNLSFDARFSKINSDGFIDRAFSNLTSYYTSAGYYSEKTIVKAILFGGLERTYQSWYGVPESRIKNDEQGMLETAATEGWNENQIENLLQSDSRTFNFYTYDNQVDDYDQHHAQLHISRRFQTGLTGNISFHYTRGKGFYEEYKVQESIYDYGIITLLPVPDTDLVRRRWLDNHFYGTTWSLQLDKKKFNSVFGGGWNFYDGDHFGEVIKTETAQIFPELPYRYYDNTGKKTDLSVYWKTNYAVTNKFYLFADLQFRGILYRGDGIESEQEKVDFNKTYNFFNPKAGMTWEFKPTWQWYSSIALAGREPVRNDVIDAAAGNTPKPEKLYDFESGFRHKRNNLALQVNYYYMHYKDQLVLTGELNDVGANLRVNVPESFRSGVEIEADFKISSRVRWQGNLTVSRNRIKEFDEVLYDYGDNFDQFNIVGNTYRNTDISFSPGIISGSQLSFKAANNLELAMLSKFVGDQYLDNTSNENRKINQYFLNDLRFTWAPPVKKLREFSLSLLAANVFNVKYESNGYTYGFLGGSTVYRQNYYYPQAGRNFLAMLTIKI